MDLGKARAVALCERGTAKSGLCSELAAVLGTFMCMPMRRASP